MTWGSRIPKQDIWDSFLNRAWSITFTRKQTLFPRLVWKAQFQRLASPGHSDSALLGALKHVRQLQKVSPFAFFTPGELTLLGMLALSWKPSNKRPCDAVGTQVWVPISAPSLASCATWRTYFTFPSLFEGGRGRQFHDPSVPCHTLPSYPQQQIYITAILQTTYVSKKRGWSKFIKVCP